MSNPTSNYGFVMPTSTDLVTDLPADFEVFGQAVDTRLAALNPSTTLGDIEYRSSTANTNSRLAIGSSGQVLTVQSGVPAWTTMTAGGYTSLANGNLSGSSLALSSISSSYKHLQLNLQDIDLTSTGSLSMTFMSLSADYTHGFYTLTGGASSQQKSAASVPFAYNNESFESGNYNGNLVINIWNYATSTTKLGDYTMYYYQRFGGAQNVGYGVFNNSGSGAASALSSITITCSTTFSAGTYRLYGVS